MINNTYEKVGKYKYLGLMNFELKKNIVNNNIIRMIWDNKLKLQIRVKIVKI